MTVRFVSLHDNAARRKAMIDGSKRCLTRVDGPRPSKQAVQSIRRWSVGRSCWLAGAVGISRPRQSRRPRRPCDLLLIRSDTDEAADRSSARRWAARHYRSVCTLCLVVVVVNVLKPHFHPTQCTQRKNRHRSYPCVLAVASSASFASKSTQGPCLACVELDRNYI